MASPSGQIRPGRYLAFFLFIVVLLYGLVFGTGDHKEIREAVQKLCERFPGEYWRKLDADRAYPTEFVTALTDAGYLATLIPRTMAARG